ncbi:MAG: hypothetical protein RIA69_02045 [Cyclobacteriaceae bacterium]
MWSCLSNTAHAQDCYHPDPTDSAYQAVPWYGDESNYTVLDRMYDSLYNLYGPSAEPLLRGYEDDVILRIPLKFWIYQEAFGVAGAGNEPLQMSEGYNLR